MKTLSKCMGMALVIGLFLLSSCGGTKLSNGWLNSAYEGRYVKSVLVVATSDQFDKRKLKARSRNIFRSMA
jgi:hypothetical protein